MIENVFIYYELVRHHLTLLFLEFYCLLTMMAVCRERTIFFVCFYLASSVIQISISRNSDSIAFENKFSIYFVIPEKKVLQGFNNLVYFES